MQNNTPTHQKSVVITGAASGIGRACAEALARKGITVFAGTRNAEEFAEVECRRRSNVIPLRLDVTKPDEIAAAAATATAATEETNQELLGIINNAGLVVAGPLEYLSTDDLRLQFDVNVFGLMAVTRAFLPHLRRDSGRVLNVGSVGGRLSTPYTGAYCASKFAVRGLTDALRMELSPAGVPVVLIEPGPIATPIWERSLEAWNRRFEILPEGATRHYGHDMGPMKKTVRKTNRTAIPVGRVVEAIGHALSAPNPRAHYLVGFDAHLQAWLSHWLPPRLLDPLLRRIMGVKGSV